jgi:hypothetical protein
MGFSNLRLAMSQKRIYGYELARALKISDASFTARMQGRAQFLPHERSRISEILAIDEIWLFSEVHIPTSVMRKENK